MLFRWLPVHLAPADDRLHNHDQPDTTAQSARNVHHRRAHEAPAGGGHLFVGVRSVWRRENLQQDGQTLGGWTGTKTRTVRPAISSSKVKQMRRGGRGGLAGGSVTERQGDLGRAGGVDDSRSGPAAHVRCSSSAIELSASPRAVLSRPWAFLPSWSPSPSPCLRCPPQLAAIDDSGVGTG